MQNIKQICDTSNANKLLSTQMQNGKLKNYISNHEIKAKLRNIILGF